MRRTIKVRRGDVMHYTWRESKAADRLNLRFFGLEPSISCGRPKGGLDGILARSLLRPQVGTAAVASLWQPLPATRQVPGKARKDWSVRQSQLILLDCQNHPKNAFCWHSICL
jgi:hypothetical protein